MRAASPAATKAPLGAEARGVEAQCAASRKWRIAAEA
jgi:hypothetical protein